MARKRIVIIGGMATGPKAAARARRLDAGAEITIVEKGTVVSFGTCGLPYYLSGLIGDLDELRRTPAGLRRDEDYFWRQKRIRVLTRTLALEIQREKKRVALFHLDTGEKSFLPYDQLVLAVGAEPVIPPLAGRELEGVFTLTHPDEAQAIAAAIKHWGVKKVAIIGAGVIGLEVADALAGRRLSVTLIEKMPQLLPGLLDPELAGLLAAHLERQRVKLALGVQVLGLEGDDAGRVRRVVTGTGAVEADLVLMACGVRPNVSLAREAGLKVGETGAMAVDEYLRTSDPAIYAGGDCVENRHLVTGRPVYTPLASIAARHGRVIGTNVSGGRERFPGILGTTVLQAFDYNLGRTGLLEKEAAGLGLAVRSTLIAGTDCSHYYPLHGRLFLKLVTEAGSGRLLGAQALGPAEVVKRLDVLATAIACRATVADLINLDLGYAPPFSSALDPVHQAAGLWQNLEHGLAVAVTPAALKRELAAGADLQLVDVREPEELGERAIKDRRVKNIPLGELRERLPELDRNRGVVTVCELGVRGYEAARLLAQEGFTEVRFLSGGLAAWLDEREG